MFGADTSLVMDAIQIGALAAASGAGAVWFALRRRKREKSGKTHGAGTDGRLEDRVRVLERIATDRSPQLRGEIEALRDANHDVRQLGGNA